MFVLNPDRVCTYTYIHTSVECLRPQLSPVAYRSCYMEAVSPLYLSSRQLSVECNAKAAYLQFPPIQEKATASVSFLAREDYDLSLFVETDSAVFP